MPRNDEPVTVTQATPARGFRIPPPPPGFVAKGPPPGWVITGPFAGDMEPVRAGEPSCDFCLDGAPHPAGFHGGR